MPRYTTEPSSGPPMADGRGRSGRGPELMPRRLAIILAGLVILQVAGRALDGLWHANHDEFEATGQQLEAHWLLWAAVLATLGFVALTLRGAGLNRGVKTALELTLWSGIAYAAVSVWHFIEHANHNDPAVAHILLAIGQVVMLGGMVLSAVRARRASVSTSAEGGLAA